MCVLTRYLRDTYEILTISLTPVQTTRAVRRFGLEILRHKKCHHRNTYLLTGWKMFKNYVKDNLPSVTLYKPQNQKDCDETINLILKSQ